MKVAYISFMHIDMSILLLKYVSKKINLDLYLIFAENNKKESIINFEDVNAVATFIEEKMNDILPPKV